MKTNDKKQTLALLAQLYPDAKPALHFNSAYELLVAVILSAQCTDERVNKVTAVLFQNYNTPQKMLTLTGIRKIYFFLRFLPYESGTYFIRFPRYFR